MRSIVPALALTTFALLAGCGLRGIQGDGHLTTDRRAVSDFTTVDAAGGFDVSWSSGPAALVITTDQNLLPHIKAEVTGHTLRVYADKSLAPTKGIKMVLSSTALQGAALTGAIHLTANHLTGPALTLTSSGAVTIDASGSVNTLAANLTGASTLRAAGLDAQDAKVTMVGASRADLSVAKHLKASIVGAGSVSYSGNPAVEQSITGAGTIRRR